MEKSERELVLEQVAGLFAMQFAERLQNGDPESVKVFAEWKQTGEVPRLVLKSIEKICDVPEGISQ